MALDSYVYLCRSWVLGLYSVYSLSCGLGSALISSSLGRSTWGPHNYAYRM